MFPLYYCTLQNISNLLIFCSLSVKEPLDFQSPGAYFYIKASSNNPGSPKNQIR